MLEPPAGHQVHSRLDDRSLETSGLLQRHRQRLFGEHVLAGGKRFQRDRDVGVQRRANHHCVDLLVGEHPVQVGGEVFSPTCLCQRARLLLNEVHRGHQTHTRTLRDVG